MKTFSLLPIEEIKTRDSFFELVIDGERRYDNFIKSLNPSDIKKVINLYKYMEVVGNGRLLPNSKLRFIEGSKAAYEFKKDDIRLYCFKFEGLYWIMAHGGLKKTQTKDISIIQDIEAKCLERGFEDGIK